MSKKQKTQTQIAIRLPDSLLARIDDIAEYMSKAGIPVTRAEVHRLAVSRGVAELEADRKKRQHVPTDTLRRLANLPPRRS